MFEPLVRGGSIFSYPWGGGGSSCFIAGIGIHFTQSTTEIIPFSYKEHKSSESWVKKDTDVVGVQSCSTRAWRGWSRPNVKVLRSSGFRVYRHGAIAFLLLTLQR